MKFSPTDFIFSNDEIGNIIKNYDWQTHPLGVISTWPKVLLHHLNTMLNSESPMCLFWGPSMFCFYNDAFRPSLGEHGKHPDILGLPAKEAWNEVWDTIQPLLENVWNTRKPSWNEDLLIPIYRNGKIEDVYWSFGYNPIYGNFGTIEGILVIVNETTNAVIRLQKLQESRNQFEFAIEAAQLGTWDYDLINHRFSINDRLRKWLGLKQIHSVSFTDAIRAITPKERERFKDRLRATFTSEKTDKFDTIHNISNLKNNKKVVRILGKVWFDDEGKIYRISGTVQDITEPHKIEKERKRSRRQLEAFSKNLEKEVKNRTEELQETNRMLTVSVDKLKKANENLQSFAYVSSHDLQEPLRKIQIFISRIVEMNRIQQLEKEYTFFQRIISSAERMRILIKDLLSFSRIGNITPNFEVINLQEIIESLVDELNEEIQDKITPAVHLDVNIKVRAIPYQIEQLFLNFLTNSIKFAHTDRALEIHIFSEKIHAENSGFTRSSEFKEFYKITFQDNGIGFDPKYNTYIFDVFKRLHSRDTYPGTGIGLAIVKQIIDNHNGFIEASGVLGQGADFVIYLPVYN